MLNPHVFPLVPYPGLAPELAARSGQGGWEAFALASPPDRLLPFVLTRTLVTGGSPWVNCASLVHADTGVVLYHLIPTGQLTPPALGLALHKSIDSVNQREHFIYTGARIPTLDLPCGVPYRLLLDNGWQSPRFVAVAGLAGAPVGSNATYQRLEWSHPGVLSGVPYGTGLTQRLYVENGGLQPADPRQVETSSQVAATGAVRQDSLAIYERVTASGGVLPRYLVNALLAARAHRSFTVDGQPYTLADGGRSLVTLTLESLTPLASRLSCPAPPLPVEAYEAVMPRGWRCGDTSDTLADYQPMGGTSCELSNGKNTGYQLQPTQDVNPYSATYGQAGTTRRTANTTACPVPLTYLSVAKTATATRNNCQAGYLGSTVVFTIAAGSYQSDVSQTDADNKAQVAATAGAQANANSQGTCTIGRRVYYANRQAKTKQVQFDLIRTDTAGDLAVTVLAQAEVNTGSSTGTDQFTQVFTIPSGSNSLLNNYITYNGAVLVQFELLEITAVNPTDYLF